jgi:hypothetical protein
MVPRQGLGDGPKLMWNTISKHAQDGSANFITTHKSKAYVNKISEICFNTDVGEGLQMKQDWQ